MDSIASWTSTTAPPCAQATKMTAQDLAHARTHPNKKKNKREHHHPLYCQMSQTLHETFKPFKC